MVCVSLFTKSLEVCGPFLLKKVKSNHKNNESDVISDEMLFYFSTSTGCLYALRMNLLRL